MACDAVAVGRPRFQSESEVRRMLFWSLPSVSFGNVWNLESDFESETEDEEREYIGSDSE